MFKPIDIFKGEAFEIEITFSVDVTDVMCVFVDSSGNELNTVGATENDGTYIIELTSGDTSEAREDVYTIFLEWKESGKQKIATYERYVRINPKYESND